MLENFISVIHSLFGRKKQLLGLGPEFLGQLATFIQFVNYGIVTHIQAKAIADTRGGTIFYKMFSYFYIF